MSKSYFELYLLMNSHFLHGLKCIIISNNLLNSLGREETKNGPLKYPSTNTSIPIGSNIICSEMVLTAMVVFCHLQREDTFF